MAVSSGKVVDLKGLVCPITQIKALEALEKEPPGTVLDIIVDNKVNLEAVVLVAKKAGHKVEQVTRDEPVFTITVRKKED